MVSSGPDTVAEPKFLRVLTGEVLDVPGEGFVRTTTDGVIRTVASPALVGNGPGYFDRRTGRWIPVLSPAAISPDGSRYTYVTAGTPGVNQIHVVDVATGRDRALSVPPGFWVPVAFTARGIYAHQSYEGVGPGLQLLDPDSGAWKTALADGTVEAVSGTVAWIGSRNPADKLPDLGGIGPANNTVSRRDLLTGATATWLYRPGTALRVTAATGGSVVVSVFDGRYNSNFVVTAPNRALRLDLPFNTDLNSYPEGFVSDSHGMWVGSMDGVFLWNERTEGVLISAGAATPAGTCA
jgi:hypothetical protein